MTMKTHKKALIGVILAAVLAIPSVALIARQDRPGPDSPRYGCPGYGAGYYGHRPFRHLDNMQYYLGLTDQQVEKIFNIHQEYREKIFKNRNSFDAIQKLREEKHKEIEKVLTDEQKKKFNEWYTFKNTDRRYHRGRGGPGGSY